MVYRSVLLEHQQVQHLVYSTIYSCTHYYIKPRIAFTLPVQALVGASYECLVFLHLLTIASSSQDRSFSVPRSFNKGKRTYFKINQQSLQVSCVALSVPNKCKSTHALVKVM